MAGTNERSNGEQRQIGPASRCMLGAIGIGSWTVGAVATFATKTSSTGAVALVGAGAVAALLAMIGRWPSRIAISGNAIVWENIDETVETQITVARAAGESDSVLRELQLLRTRLDTLRTTGSVPMHPAERYDLSVERAIRRCRPNALVVRHETRSRQVSDYVVRDEGHEVLVETKWRADPKEPYRGTTLEPLIQQMDSTDRLLVVVNAVDATRATELLARALPGRAGVVTWLDESDDEKLGSALALFL